MPAMKPIDVPYRETWGAMEELQRGYHLNGRVLRHALVKVSMGPGPQAPQPSGDQPSDQEQAG